MWRGLHGWLGLVLAPLLLALALSGVVLAWKPLVTPADQGGLAAALARLEAIHPGLDIDRLERDPMGRLTLFYAADGHLHEDHLDPQTGALSPKTPPGGLRRFAQNLHREFLLGRPGRLISGAMGAVMLVMALSGLRLMTRRAGGWRALMRPASGQGAGRWHVICAQATLLPLLVMAGTALWMSLATFGVIPTDLPRLSALPESTRITPLPPAASLPALDRPLADLRLLTFPIPGDWFDVYVLQTEAARIFVDQGTGAVLDTRPLPVATRLSALFYRLHSGEGLRLWAVLLTISALAVPVFIATGGWLLARRRLHGPRGGRKAPVMIYVGSENGTTWAFAHALGAALRAAGQAVGLSDLNHLGTRPPETHTALILTATYGNGTAPANAARAAMPGAPPLRYAVLGFGDRQFPGFCAHAERLETAMTRAGHRALLPLHKIHQQSGQSFTAWARDLGAALDLGLSPRPPQRRPRTRPASVHSARHIASDGDTTTLLRLSPPRGMRWRAGDLVAIQPEPDHAPRLYSIASPAGHPTLDLLVREHPGGACSPQLCRLRAGDGLRLSLRRHPFRLPAKGPVIMIATGTGIAPFIGMIGEAPSRDLTLYWGTRLAPETLPFRDTLSRDNLRLRLALSRRPPRQRVTDLIREDAARLRPPLLDRRATLMICGSAHAAADIHAAFADILSGSGLTPEGLKRQKRLLEDVY